MLRRYRDRRTEQFAYGEFVKAFSGIDKTLRRRLTFVEEAKSLSALSTIPGHRFEAMQGDRQGQYSIRVNDQWRICFEWPDDQTGAVSIEIVDYH
ncbi:type II toxin-antitoxin system RelE/ParE family toxin [soil metagenome]